MKLPHVKRKTNSEKYKFGSNKKKYDLNELWMDWAKHLEKNRSKNSKKAVKIKMKLPHVNKKPPARKRIFVQTPFSHSTLKLERKNSRRKTTRFFAPFPVSAWPKSLLQFYFKNHEKILEKDSAPPQYNSNSLSCKKPRAPQYSSAQLTASQL